MEKSRSEHYEQAAFMQRVEWLTPGLRPFVFAVPNGGKRSKRTAITLRAEGVTAGVPDLWVMLPRHGFHALAIEMKRADVERPADNQDEFHRLLRAQGYCVVVASGVEAAWAAFDLYTRENP